MLLRYGPALVVENAASQSRHHSAGELIVTAWYKFEDAAK